MALLAAKDEESDSYDTSNHSSLCLSDEATSINVQSVAKKDEAMSIDTSHKCYFHPKECPAPIEYARRHFAEGKFRYVLKGKVCLKGVKQCGKPFGQRVVIKKWKEKHVFDAQFFERDLRVAGLAMKLAEKWNKKYSKSNRTIRVLKPISMKDGTPRKKNAEHTKESEVAFNERVLVEDYLDGKFTKWNSNSGWVYHKSSIIQAFCHWTYHYSNGAILFCDAQGIKTNHEYILTDPCLLSQVSGHYGSSDCGREYMINWFNKHDCNKYCDKKWKKAKGNIINETITPESSSTFVWELAGYAKKQAKISNNIDATPKMPVFEESVEAEQYISNPAPVQNDADDNKE